MQRKIPFEGVDNFRDFGGYAAAGGKALASGRLYRSGHYGRATEADLERLADLGVAMIVDLRRAQERERDVSRRWPGFSGLVIDTEMGAVDEWGEFMQRSDLSAQSFRDYMTAYYRNAPFEPRHQDMFRRYFQALAETDGAVIVHCTAGKDRTGVLCALTHHVAGVSDDDIVADYLLTNDPDRVAARIPFVIEAMQAQTGRAPEEAAVRVAIGVDESYLRGAFAAMSERHGSVDGYLEEALGVDAGLREKIHAKLVA
jgi:protein tyrosine/serine phosphatase